MKDSKAIAKHIQTIKPRLTDEVLDLLCEYIEAKMTTGLSNFLKTERKAEWLDAQDAVVKYENALSEVAGIKFDSIESQFDNTISLITHGINQIEKEIDAVEQAGMIAGESYYNELQKLQEKNTEALKKEYNELTSILNKALDNGTIEEYSEEWYKMVGSINSVEDVISDAELAAAKYGLTISLNSLTLH